MRWGVLSTLKRAPVSSQCQISLLAPSLYVAKSNGKGLDLMKSQGGVLGLPLPSCDLKKPFCP